MTKDIIDNIINSPLSKIRERFRDCTNSTHNKEECLDETFSTCAQRARVFKFIRLSTEVVGRLMRSVPDLKVIHLLRDPRGILKSRQHVGLLPGGDFNLHSKALCTQLLRDIHETKRLQQNYPGRIKTIMYEDLAERPQEGAKQLYDFAGIQFNNEIRQYVIDITAAQENSGAYGISKSSSKAASYDWRNHLPFKKSEEIDNNCQDLYTLMGLRVAESEEQLRNTNISLRVGMRNIGDYLIPATA